MDRIDDELERRTALRELMVLMHHRAYPVGLGAEWSHDADHALVSLFHDQLPQFPQDRFRFNDIESTASRRPHHLASNVHPTDRWSARLRTIECFMIRRDTQPSAVKVPVGERNNVAMRTVMVAQVHDVLVAAQAARQVE